MGLIFEGALVMGMNVMRMLFARFPIGRRICCGCGRRLDGCRNRQLGLGFWRCGFLRGMTTVVLIVGVLIRMVRTLMNVLVRMLMAFMIMMIRIRRVMPGIVGVGMPVFTMVMIVMLMILRLGDLRCRGRRWRLERFSDSSSASRCARSSASIRA